MSEMTNTGYEAVIGLEVHAELKTKTKIFCSCPAQFGGAPNTNVCPVCLGMPGALPMLGEEPVEFAVRAGLALDCRINRTSWFDRKNYYYPDLPKGYQITQYERPICEGGGVPVTLEGRKYAIELERIHLEEDAGKLIHRGDSTYADYNRSGVPLIEIVSRPVMHSAAEVKAYLTSLRRILLGIGVSDCRMNEGSLRCDVNVSVRPAGTEKMGVKTEIKNLNSISYAGRAVDDEILRQIQVLTSGGEVVPETRRFNEDTGKTERMRLKETAVDYRYFTEPNIPPLILSEEYIENIRRKMPLMPDERAEKLVGDYGVRPDDAYLLTASPQIADYFEACAEKTEYKSAAVSLFVGEILPKLDENAFSEYVNPGLFGEACTLFGEGKVVSGNAKKLIHMAAESGISPFVTAEKEKMLKISDENTLLPYVERAISANAKAVADFKKGKAAAAKQILGAVMRETGGAADPSAAEKLILAQLTK
ncbi:MAG: Asp-tRNA(Asn)/Glu-tRNA(Gln) amidotransferase subunit GatB [Clostridia bacterium]|nr:Asp-tRNA(Asn)/Glu-tRNA(Gln) amidotransferase subunit GatB [Clostridia bacterium]